MASTQGPSEGNYSFVVHSDPAVSSGSPSTLENSNLARQKRRRTSPRDHAILEAAYQRNSKPDKHERADIVSKVELGEKEVQIWFQNRRQNDRRKSKPLQPHELLAHLRNGAPTQAVHLRDPSEEDQGSSIEPIRVSLLDPQRPSSRSSSIHELLNPPSNESATARNGATNGSKAADLLPTPPSSLEQADQTPLTNTSAAAQNPVPSTNNGPSHFRKRSHEDMAGNASNNVSDSLKPVAQLPQSKTLARSSSFVRLAMTVDGAVKVRTNDEPTPSPPKQRTLPPIALARKRESLGRSQSAVENGFVFRDINPPTPKPGSAGFGRSRDARTWEFYCDRDSGDALSTQAEAERSGSAIGAINLIRSRSGRNKSLALSPNPGKQNARRVRVNQQVKPKLSRAMSSMARLQSLDNADESQEKDVKRTKHNRSPSGDSDKENWAPGTRLSQHSLRRTHPSIPRNSILQENDFPSARDAATNVVAQEQENRTVTGKERAKGDDMDCIQGLLSLSQGAWH